MITITGGSGFLGKALIGWLQRRFRQEKREKGKGDPRWNFVNFDVPFHTIIWPDPWNPMASKNGEFKGLDDLDDKVACSEFVIHCAAVADLNESAKHPEMNERINIEGTRNVAEACKRHGKLMVFISTCCAYGNAEGGKAHEGVIAEETEPHPTEIYAESKLRGENMLHAMEGLRYRICRIATLYGPGMRPALFNFIALKSVAEGKEILVHGDGKQTRTYGYIDDVADGIMTVALKGKDGEVYNIAGNEETSVMDSIHTAEQIIERPAVLRFAPDRAGQIRRERISSGKLENLGWHHPMTFENGMRVAWAWICREGK